MYKKIPCLFLFLLFAGYGCAAGSSELERTVQAQGQLLIDNQQRINDLQSELSSLRGQLEETSYQLNQTIERQKMILQQLSGNTSFGTPASTPNTESNTSVTNSSSPASATTTASGLSGWSASGNDKNDYDFIMKFVNEGKQNTQAIAAFQQFLQVYPKSSYCANVNYWLGQLFYKQPQKDDALYYYATVVKDFPSSAKAADSLYKVGLIFLEKGEKAKAKAVFQQVVNKYPKDKNTVDLANKKLASL